jgi:hypothetical protein
MPHNEARAWWADVADVRQNIERRRADEAPATQDDANPGDELAHVRARRANAARERAARSGGSGRFDREHAEPSYAPRRTGRFDRARERERDQELDIVPAPSPVPRAPAASTELPAGAPRRPLIAPVPERRTVQITGRPGERRLIEIQRRRAPRGPAERVHASPDRLAMWAVALAFFLILVAVLSSHA